MSPTEAVPVPVATEAASPTSPGGTNGVTFAERINDIGATTSRLSRNASKRIKKSITPAASTPAVARAEDPTDPAPAEGPRPSAALLRRMLAFQKLTKSLQKYFEGLSASHVGQAKAIVALGAPNVLRPPFLDDSLFLPAVATEGKPNDVAWANLLTHLRESTVPEAEAHTTFAKVITDDIIPVLVKLHVEIEEQVGLLDSEVNSLADDVVRLRANYDNLLATLTKSLATYKTSPGGVDPFVARAATELQGINKVNKENQFVTSSLEWQEKAKKFETSVDEKLKGCMKTWEEARTKFLTAGLQSTAATGTKANSIKPGMEWNYFMTLHELLPSNLPQQNVEKLDYPGRNDEATKLVKNGTLERKKRFVQNWKKAYFVLTPAGFLHEYPSGDSLLEKPHISLFLPHCTIGPVIEHINEPTKPEDTPIETVPTPAEAIKAAAVSQGEPATKAVELPTYKFLLEGRRAANDGMVMGLGESTRFFRAATKAEVESWREEIAKFTKVAPPPGTPSKKVKKEDVSAPVEELEGDAHASDDEAFAEAKKQPVVPDKDTVDTPPASTSLLKKAKLIRIPKGKKAAVPSAEPAAAEATDPAATATATAPVDAAAAPAAAPGLLGRLVGGGS